MFRLSTSTASSGGSSAGNSTTSSADDTVGTIPADYQSNRRNVASEIRNVRSKIMGGVETCKELKVEKKDRDPYWRSRWCEECTKKGCDARKRFLGQFGKA
jgi:hypothetical protein